MMPCAASFRVVALMLGAGAAAGALVGLSSRRAAAVLKLDVTQGNVAPVPIAIPEFVAVATADPAAGRNVSQIISSNLQRSGLFAPIDPAAFIEKISTIDTLPRFPDWRAINAQALVTGRITQGEGRLKAEFRLWDVFAGAQLHGQQYTTTADNWRRIAHIISDAIYERLTGEKGYFDSRVVFVDESGPKERRIKRLALMDQDGANVRYLTRGDDLVLTPRFSSSPDTITYMSYGQGDPKVYLMNIETGQREIVSNFPGMSFSPRFSPDSQRVIFSLQRGGNSNLFVMDLAIKGHDAAHRHAGDRYRTVLLAGWVIYLFRVRPRRQAADLRDGRNRRAGTTHQLRRRRVFHTGLVAARRLHSLHQAIGRQVRHRHHARRRIRRAHPDRGLP